jgi:hypothetical protein
MTTPLTQFVTAELARLDLCLHRQVLRLRARYQLSLDEFRGLYVSDAQVDTLVRDWQEEKGGADFAELDKRVATLRRQNWSGAAADSPWQHIVGEFGLSTFEVDTILLAFAPQVDLKYEVIYAYLNNDVSRKWPTLDLALQLFGAGRDDRIHLYPALQHYSVLFHRGLLQPLPETTEKASWLAQGFALNYSLTQFLLGLDALDARISQFLKPISAPVEWNAIAVPSQVRTPLRNVPNLIRSVPNHSAIIFFTGPSAAEKRPAAQAICHDLRLRLLHLDLEAAKDARTPIRTLAQITALERSLRPCALFLTNADSLSDSDPNTAAQAWRLLSCFTESRGPVFVAANHSEQEIAAVCHRHFHHRELMRSCATMDFPKLEYMDRRAAWETALAHANSKLASSATEDLAARFVFTHAEIASTIRSAQNRLVLRRLPEETSPAAPPQPLGESDLLAAARAQCGHELGQLAPKVSLAHAWSDLVLPEGTLRQVREAADAIRNQHLVYLTWGFGQRLALARGLKILFAGASGTGKSMTASVIARDLSLDLYKIDLSAVVSKYIGETEKNLDRIFRAAQSSNAILFFDEADALFGKRSEVSDAHDRYANIEVAYLLQKMEEHDGAVILASNLSHNIDEAFTRRLHYVIEFPLPAEMQRHQIWRGMFPPDAPLADDVDFTFLARQFPVSGGDIKNVVLAAAFLAAQNGHRINMAHLIDAMRQQIIKSGRIPAAADFKQYHGRSGRSIDAMAEPPDMAFAPLADSGRP